MSVKCLVLGIMIVFSSFAGSICKGVKIEDDFGDVTKNAKPIYVGKYNQIILKLKMVNEKVMVEAEYREKAASNSIIPAGHELMIALGNGDILAINSINEAQPKVEAKAQTTGAQAFTTFWYLNYEIPAELSDRIIKNGLSKIRIKGPTGTMKKEVSKGQNSKIIRVLECFKCSDCE